MNRMVNIAAILILFLFSAGVSEAEISDDNDNVPMKSTTAPEIAAAINPILLMLLGLSDDAISSNWSSPQPILEGVDTGGDVAMTRDSADTWHLVYKSSSADKAAVIYVNSVTAPNSETIAEYPLCSQLPCAPNQIMELEGVAIAQDLSGGLHVAYSVQEMNFEIKIMYAVRAPSGNWSVPQMIVEPGEAGSHVSIAIDSAGNWHLVYDGWKPNVAATIEYVNSVIAPNAIPIAEHPLCTQFPCQTEQFLDFEGIAIAKDAKEGLHVAYSVQQMSAQDMSDIIKIMYTAKAPSSSWAAPQLIAEGAAMSGEIAMTIDPAGNWHLVDFSFNPNSYALKYFNSIIAPNSETIAEYPRCTQPSCEPGQIRDLAGNAVIRDMNGRFHVAYSVEVPGGEHKIMATSRP